MADDEDDKGFDFDIPVVASRREFFEQEAIVSGPPDKIETDLVPDDVAENLRSMREEASRRTAEALDEPEPLEAIRARIDELDAQLTGLLARRQALVEAAGRLKDSPEAVHDPDRQARVIAAARERALGAGLDPAVAEAVWRAMIDAFVRLEMDGFDGR